MRVEIFIAIAVHYTLQHTHMHHVMIRHCVVHLYPAQTPMRQGSYVALITPMTETGAINIPELRSLLQFHLESGTDGLCILGTTGEASVLTVRDFG